MMPSGRAPLFNNRVAWAVTYLAQAAVLRRTRRGYTRITDRGRELLAKHSARIGSEDLNEFPEFRDFLSRSSGRPRQPTSTAPIAPPSSAPALAGAAAVQPSNGAGPTADATPTEIMDSAYRALRSVLADELVERVKGQSPEFFEDLVLDGRAVARGSRRVHMPEKGLVPA
jgi:restriction system protein